MNGPELLDTIRNQGHWQVIIRPTTFNRERIPRLSTCWDMVRSSQVKLRGYRPNINDNHPTPNRGEWIESGADLGRFIEYWRLYKSGQFALHDTYLEDRMELPWSSSEYERGRPSRYLTIESVVYQLTELFEFAARLWSHDALRGEDLTVSVILTDTEGRDLVYWEGFRFLFGRYVCSEPDVRFERTIEYSSFVADPAGLALDVAIDIFERFNWLNPSTEILTELQKRLLERR
jgi:hypothetical protein